MRRRAGASSWRCPLAAPRDAHSWELDGRHRPVDSSAFESSNAAFCGLTPTEKDDRASPSFGKAWSSWVLQQSLA